MKEQLHFFSFFTPQKFRPRVDAAWGDTFPSPHRLASAYHQWRSYLAPGASSKFGAPKAKKNFERQFCKNSLKNTKIYQKFVKKYENFAKFGKTS